MYIDKDSVIINGTSMGQYLTECKFGYNKLWSSDSGRNLAGAQSGTLIGIFPKLSLQFRALSQSELNIVAQILDTSSQTTTYFDANKNGTVTMSTYTGDWEVSYKGLNKAEAFSCSVIARKRR